MAIVLSLYVLLYGRTPVRMSIQPSRVAIRIIIHGGFFFFDSEINKNNCNKGVYALKNGCERTKRSGWKG